MAGKDWLVANNRLNGNLQDEGRIGPVVIDAVSFGLDEIAFRFASATVTVFTALELLDRERTICVVDAEIRCRQEGWYKASGVVGEVVAECSCNESGIRVETESGLELICRSDGSNKCYSVGFSGGEVYRC